ncbi:hypothetical protein H072_4815 [Dactylellina haptotyla CBS 200.50]|uniref:Solute carrier family 40 member n=1 Tax=Dactylellina haptotyla (strain CBS 200.50) TaxID=1284197 RepID=S8C0T3_DACHA|nr:hypothetical protein H072_4815 [Dactylellina haptotyla CBS 200.50]
MAMVNEDASGMHRRGEEEPTSMDSETTEDSQPLISSFPTPQETARLNNLQRGARVRNLSQGTLDLKGLYLSHFLSTWNSRTYEFAAVVFTVEAFPNTLLPASISGIAQCITLIILSPLVGAWADHSASRLNSLKVTILSQRLAALAACLSWTLLLWSPSNSYPIGLKWAIFSVIVVLSCVSRLAAGGNVVVMERDWVPTLAPVVGESSLHILNATMRRIDLMCKVLAPGFVTLLPTVFGAINATAERSIFWSVIAIALMSLLSPWVELVSAQKVWHQNELLQAPKIMEREVAQNTQENTSATNLMQHLRHKFSGFMRFCQSVVFLPTISISLMYLSVLTFSSPMITFLLNAGFSLPVVTVARLSSSLLEVSATAVMPWGVKTIRNRPVKYWRRANEEEEVGFLEEYSLPSANLNIDKAEVERVGLWAVWWMTLSLIPAVYGVVGLAASEKPNPPGLPNLLFSLPMLFGVAFSRIGLWTYDLTYSQLQQTLPPPALRGEFTGIEQSFVSAAELLQWILTAIMSRPEKFNVLAFISWTAVLGAAACYAWFIRKRRGHLLHVKISNCCKN